MIIPEPAILSREIGEFLRKNKLIAVTAESCTAGLISSTLAMTPSSSHYLDGGFVVYSVEAKNKVLNVGLETVERFDVTSEEVAREMAIGALEKSPRSNIALSTTGLAGPSGGSEKIPVGTVCFAWSFRVGQNILTFSDTQHLQGNRLQVCHAAVAHSLVNIEKYFNLSRKNQVKPKL